MKNLIVAFRSLFKKGQHNVIKILSLGIGLAAGLVLISKAYFLQTYDNFFPNKERIYLIVSKYTMNGETDDYGKVSGGVAPAMQRDVPGVETATRFTYMGYQSFFTPDKNRYSGTFIMADTNLFDVLPRPLLYGNAKEVLDRPMYALVSEKMARKLGKGNEVIGQTFQFDVFPDRTITVGGIFEDLPENSHLQYDVILSLSSLPAFFHDGRDNWLGNDRYMGYVKLAPGIQPDSLAPAIRKMHEKYVDPEKLEKAGIKISYTLMPLLSLHKDSPDTKRMTHMLLLLAFALLLTAVMNYILIVVSGLIGRAREFAVHKCYGAGNKNISSLIFHDTFLHLVLAIITAACIILLFQGTIEEILGTSLQALFTPRALLLLTGVCALIFLITGLVPSYLFSRIPVATAFRSYRETKRIWKRILLFIQFSAAAFLLILLILIARQYDRMIHDDPGYTYENLLFCDLSGTSSAEKERALDELRRLPEITGVATASGLPIYGSSGNNVLEVGKDRELFNFVDLYGADHRLLSLLDVPVIAGRGFDPHLSDSASVMVSRSFADKLIELLGWEDGVVGKPVQLTEHGVVTIIGVYENFRVGSLTANDPRPSALFPASQPANVLLIRVRELTPENIRMTSELIKRLFPEKEIRVTPYTTEMANLYSETRLFRNTVMIGGIITLLISLIGLIGYTNDETLRRSREIAIRKVNGATAGNIIRLLTGDMVWIALPAILAGIACAYLTGEKWLQQFSEKIALHPVLFLTGSLIILIVVTGCVILLSWKVANENPAKSIKNE